MKILVILPVEHPVTKAQIERARRGIAYRFPHPEELKLSAPKRVFARYGALMPDEELIRREDKKSVAAFDILVYLEGRKELCPFRYGGLRHQRVYKVDYAGKLLCCEPLDDRDYQHYRTHVFNWVGPRTDDNFYYFPYGYLFRMTGLGPTNAFGHRITANLDLVEKRDASHKLVAVFGGSSAWSIYSYYEEMFAARLEAKLNQYGSGLADRLSFTVLNFAMPGNVVLNQNQTYMLFCQKLKPDVVISHDGVNDLSYGKLTSPYLLNEHDITYQNNFEAWSHMLHGTHQFELGWSRDKMPAINFPRSIIKSYLFRKGQFRDVVEAFGGIFIAALQPLHRSKKELSHQEKEWMDYFKPNEEPHKNLHLLYEKYLETLKVFPRHEYEHFVDFHEIFSRYGQETTLLADPVHTVPAGDEVVAEHYFEYLKEKVMPRWADNKGSNAS